MCERSKCKWDMDKGEQEDKNLDMGHPSSDKSAVNHASGVPGPTFMLLTPFSIPAPAALIETPVGQSLDFFGETLVSRAIDGPRIDSESKKDPPEGSPLPTVRERFFKGRGELKDFVISEGGGGDVNRSDLMGLGTRVRWGETNSLELEGEVL